VREFGGLLRESLRRRQVRGRGDRVHRERRGLRDGRGVLLGDLHRWQVRGQCRVSGRGRDLREGRGVLWRHVHEQCVRVDRADGGIGRRDVVSDPGRDLHLERCLLQWSLRAGDRPSRRAELHRCLPRGRRRVHARAGLLRARLLRRQVHLGEALHGDGRSVQGKRGVLLEPLHERQVRDRSGELDLPSDG
jgi:hypothetical protein